MSVYKDVYFKCKQAGLFSDLYIHEGLGGVGVWNSLIIKTLAHLSFSLNFSGLFLKKKYSLNYLRLQDIFVFSYISVCVCVCLGWGGYKIFGN